MSGDLPGALRPLLRARRAGQQARPVRPHGAGHHAGRGPAAGPSGACPRGWSLAREYPLSTRLLAVTHAWSRPGAGGFVVASKGAPEAIADLCRLTPEEQAAPGHGCGGAGLGRPAGPRRGGGRGRGRSPRRPAPARRSQFVGLIGLEDPLRPAVPGAVAECRRAGIRVVMITGDYPVTAQSIARQAGLETRRWCSPGRRSTGCPTRPWPAEVARVSVFARVVPEQKLRLVNALQGEPGDRGHDRRRRQRRPGAQGGAHRHRHGRAGHRCGSRVGRPDPPRRRLLVDRGRGAARAADLRQHQEGGGLHLRGARPHRRAVDPPGVRLRIGRSCSSRCTSCSSS